MSEGRKEQEEDKHDPEQELEVISLSMQEKSYLDNISALVSQIHNFKIANPEI